jgi:hypothetical protein
MVAVADGLFWAKQASHGQIYSCIYAEAPQGTFLAAGDRGTVLHAGYSG